MSLQKRVMYSALGIPILALAVAGCGSSATPTASSSPKHVTITFEGSLVRGPYSTYMQTLVKKFEKQNPHITVTLIGQPNWMVLHAALITAVTGGSPPTIGQVENSWVPRYAQSNALVPLNSFIKGPSGLSATQIRAFWPQIWNQQRFSGKVYTMPFATSDTILYYNASWLMKDHLPVPTTLQQLTNDMKAATSTSHNTWGISMDPGTSSAAANGTYWFISLLHAYGGHLIQGNKIVWDSSAGVHALQYIQNLYRAGALKLGNNYPGQAALMSDHALFDISSDTSYPYFMHARTSSFNLEAIPLPPGPAGQGDVSTGFNLAIFSAASAAQQQAAWQFLKFINTPANQAYWSENTAYLPTTSTSMSDISPSVRKQPWLTAGTESLPYARKLPAKAGLSQIVGNLSAAIDHALITNENAGTALQTSAQAAQQLLAP